MSFTKAKLLRYEPTEFYSGTQVGQKFMVTYRISIFWGLIKFNKTDKSLVPYKIDAEEYFSKLLNIWKEL